MSDAGLQSNSAVPLATGASGLGRGCLQLGSGRRLGAHIEGQVIEFALAAPHATRVELCLFDPTGRQETARWQMAGPQHGIWHGVLPLGPGIGLGLVYGYRVHGPWHPAQGHRFNPAKVLLDPYAREVVGRYDGSDIHSGGVTEPDPRDNAASALKARVVDDLLPMKVARPAIDPAQRVLYELHVKSFTTLNPAVPEALRGTFAGLAHPVAIDHLRDLGISTVSLMPVAERADEARLQAMGLRNHWGYTPIAWSAPEQRFWSGQAGSSPRSEFHALVEALHSAGLEVVLDVVYNHSAETDEFGPTLSLRGIDNALYYHLLPEDRSRYANWTGCGNCLRLDEPLVLRMVMDSLRLWVTEFGVDGFRFDLAPVLGRRSGDGQFDPRAALWAAIAQDPVLSQCLMIAEPWDIGPNGYQLGSFPVGWLEWNDRFRDTQRAFWLHQQGTRGEWAARLAGSSDVFQAPLRPAHSSVNFITAHDGFTLRDLVSYTERHNLANGEGNRDGHAHNFSVNNGVEGDSSDAQVLARRAQQRRALLASLLFSLGTPMLLSGDEIGHSQGGNNNAYCQDNAITWLDWQHADRDLLRFVRTLLKCRREMPLLAARGWWQAEANAGATQALWFQASGARMENEGWSAPGQTGLQCLLQQAASGNRLLLMLNAASHASPFTLPAGRWQLQLDSAEPDALPRPLPEAVRLPAQTLWLASGGATRDNA